MRGVMDVMWRLAGLLALVCANGLFVAAEFSIVTVRKTRVDQLIAEGHRGARAVRRAVTAPDRYIAATPLGLPIASQEAGVLEEQEEQMLHRVFGFADLTAGQVMIPRTELVAVAAEAPLRELIVQIGQGRHTRLPVYRGDLDDVLGMLHVTDVVKALSSGDD